MTTRSVKIFKCDCGWIRHYESTLILDHEARRAAQIHVRNCEVADF